MLISMCIYKCTVLGVKVLENIYTKYQIKYHRAASKNLDHGVEV